MRIIALQTEGSASLNPIIVLSMTESLTSSEWIDSSISIHLECFLNPADPLIP